LGAGCWAFARRQTRCAEWGSATLRQPQQLLAAAYEACIYKVHLIVTLRCVCVCVCVCLCATVPAQAAYFIVARHVRPQLFGPVISLFLSAGIIGTAAIAAVLPAVPIEAFPWLHLGMGAAAAVVTWGAAALEQVTTRHELAVLAMQARMPQWRLRLHSLVTARTARLAEHHHKSALRILALLRTLPRAFWVVCAANALAWGLSDAFDAIGPAAFMVWCGLRHCCCCHCCFWLVAVVAIVDVAIASESAYYC
jgi:hypothetical protein